MKLLFLFGLFCICLASKSYAPGGTWVKSKDPLLECKERYLCTPDELTWKSDNNPKLINHKEACDALIDAGITRIDFHGDSYMRQIYAALLITLNGNYVNGSIANTPFAHANGAKDCTYHKQFAEKHCGVKQLNHGPRVCDGKITLDPLLNGLDNLNQCKSKKGSIALFSWGNYKVGPQYFERHGVNNATAYAKFFEDSGLCPKVRDYTSSSNGENRNCNIYWISTHYRLKAYYDDEKENIIRKYNNDMREFIESKSCGDINYIDVYNMTRVLGSKYNDIAMKSMSYDHVHWGMEVNLVKAQIIMNALLSSVSVSVHPTSTSTSSSEEMG
jgi:hypothetical protein